MNIQQLAVGRIATSATFWIVSKAYISQALLETDEDDTVSVVVGFREK